MTRGKKSPFLLLLFFVNSVVSDDTFDIFRPKDPCVPLCDKIPQMSVTNEYEKSCCQRGCRFFNLVDFHHGLPSNITISKNACHSSCEEAYKELTARAACTSGCEFMAEQRMPEWLSVLSMFYVDDSDMLSMSIDMPENDAMTDPGLRKELVPGWWDTEGFKLPQTFIKTIPRGPDTMGDYSGFPIPYSERLRPYLTRPNSSFVREYNTQKARIPAWAIHLGLVVFIVMMNCLRCVCSEDREGVEESIVTTNVPVGYEKENVMDNVFINIPEDIVPLHKTPPPKYSEIADINEVTFKQ